MAGTLAGLVTAAVLGLPAHADDGDVGSGTVSVTVEIQPLECVTACGGGAPPVTGLPATGLAPVEPLLWLAMALLAIGTALALRAWTARQMRLVRTPSPANAYAGLSGESDPTWAQPSAQEPAARRRIERGGRA